MAKKKDYIGPFRDVVSVMVEGKEQHVRQLGLKQRPQVVGHKVSANERHKPHSREIQRAGW